MKTSPNLGQNLGFSRLVTDIGAVASLGLVCLLVGTGIKYWLSTSKFSIEWSDLLLSIFWMTLATLVPLVVRHTDFSIKYAAVMPILTVAWRFNLVAIALLISAATKWPLDKSFAGCLLGCYFPFIILESALSVKHVIKDSRQR